MSTIDNTSFPVAILAMPKSDKPLLGYAKGILVALTGNPAFADLSPMLVGYAKDVNEYDKAETQAATKAIGAAALRNARRKKVIADLFHLCDAVQGIAETQASPADAAALILSAGMQIRKVGKHAKPPISARPGPVSGTAQLDAKAVATIAVYTWQYSVNQVDWIDAHDTFKASVLLTGLTPETRYYFRFRAFTRAGTTDFSQVVSLFVL
jgi:hypothetical protein